MKKFVLIILIAYIFSSCSRSVYETLNWQSTEVTADGEIPEWSNPLPYYDSKRKINYNITNDRKNLYVCMNISDEIMLTKILRSGMEFRIDTSVKKAYPITFVFPIENKQFPTHHRKSEDQSERTGGDERESRSAMVQKKLGQATEFQLIGFKSPFTGIFPLHNNIAGISAAVHFDKEGIMYYEAIIPFTTFYKSELTGADSNRVFAYEIKVNGLPAPGGGSGGGGSHSGGGHHSGGGGGGMGGGGHSGGGHSGGGGGGQASGNSELYITNKVISKMKFSYK